LASCNRQEAYGRRPLGGEGVDSPFSHPSGVSSQTSAPLPAGLFLCSIRGPTVVPTVDPFGTKAVRQSRRLLSRRSKEMRVMGMYTHYHFALCWRLIAFLSRLISLTSTPVCSQYMYSSRASLASCSVLNGPYSYLLPVWYHFPSPRRYGVCSSNLEGFAAKRWALARNSANVDVIWDTIISSSVGHSRVVEIAAGGAPAR
jgi:hypothetical protein